MNERDEEESPSATPADPRPKIVRWVGFFVAAPVVVVFLLIMYFVVRTELAHDDEICPFDRVETRELSDGARVHDEVRQCQEDVREHRWLVERGADQKELGRRRLPNLRFDEDAWQWTVEDGPRGAHVHVQNDGVEDAHFHERAPDRE